MCPTSWANKPYHPFDVLLEEPLQPAALSNPDKPSGSLGLDALCRQAYRLIILDIQMPIMTGLEFLAEYNKWPVNHVPVLITSGEERLENVHLPAFVIGRLPKPFDLDQLLKLVKKYALPVNG